MDKITLQVVKLPSGNRYLPVPLEIGEIVTAIGCIDPGYENSFEITHNNGKSNSIFYKGYFEGVNTIELK